MKPKHFTVIALAVFVLAVLIGDVASKEYHPLAEPVSRYVNTATGWVTTLGLFCFGVGAALTAWHTRSKLLAAAAILVVVAAVVPADPPGHWSNPSLSDTIHGVTALAAFAGLTVSALRLGNRRFGQVAVAATVVMTVTLVDVMTVRRLGAGDVPTFLGLTERVALMAYVAWMIATVLAKRNDGRDARLV